MSSALEHSHIHTTFHEAIVSRADTLAVEHVKIVPPQDGSRAVRMPDDCERIIDTGGVAEAPLFVRYYADDGVLVEARWFQDGRRLSRASRLLDTKKITHWQTWLEVLGWILDTQQLSITMTLHKQQKLQRLLVG